jgi:putative two-component system response regulator
MDSSQKYKIMLVDDNISNLTMGKNLLKDKYDVFTIPSADKFFDLLKNVKPDLVLLDVEMPKINGYETIKRFKADESTKDIPVIFLTSKTDVVSELEGLSLGAADYVYKPFSPPLLKKRIENQLLMFEQKNKLIEFNQNLHVMVEQKTEQVQELQNAILSTLAGMVEFRDDNTGGHIDRTSKYLEILFNGMMSSGLYAPEIDGLNMQYILPSSQLHDVGKIAIPDSILKKPGKLTDEEFEIMKKHTTYGVDIIDRIAEQTSEHEYLDYARIFAAGHHEKWAGGGYPKGLEGDDIPLLGRILAFSDVYDALVSERPYKKPFTPEEATEIIVEGKGTQFDPKLTDLFVDLRDEFAAVAKEESRVIKAEE